jgi:histidyl-tRNA synthetase
MKKADKSGAKVALLLGEDEVQQGMVTVKILRELDAQAPGSQRSVEMSSVSQQLKELFELNA